MYNFLVTAKQGAWDSRFYEYPRDRFCEYTDEQIKTRFSSLTPKAIKELTSIPSLFAYEGTEHDLQVGYIKTISDRGRHVYFEFEFEPRIPPIPFLGIEPLRLPLDIADRWELSRTHWAIKDVDLLTVLASVGLVNRSLVPPRLDTRAFVKSAVEASIFARPRLPCLSEDELVTIAAEFNYKRGEIADAVEAAVRARELVLDDGRLWPGAFADRLDAFSWRDKGDLRNPKAFEAVHGYLLNAAREHGIRSAIAERAHVVDHAERVAGVSSNDAEAAITCLLLSDHFEAELPEGTNESTRLKKVSASTIRLVAGRERWLTPNDQLRGATQYDRGEPGLAAIRDAITRLSTPKTSQIDNGPLSDGERDLTENPYSFSSETSDLESQELDVREIPFTVSTLLQKVGKNQLILTPAFQRRQVWKPSQQSRFIEAVLLNYPLPPLFLNQDRQGRYLVIDGLQRTSTLKNFCEGRFALQNLERLTILNGKKWAELPTELHSRIEDRTINCYVLKPSVPVPVINDIFARINTGGTELNRQEIRHALYQGPATIFLDELSTVSGYRDWLGHLLNPARMGDVEAALRCIAFARVDPEIAYDDDMDAFLVRTMKELNASSEDERQALKLQFARTWPNAKQAFGDNAFRLATAHTKGRINLAITESVYRFLCLRTDTWVRTNEVRLRENYARLLESKEYLDSVRYATGDKNRVRTRFRLAHSELGAGCVD